MKQFLLLVACFLLLSPVYGQVSHGGEPLFLPNLLKSSTNNFFIEMPSFDVKEMLREDSLNASNMRGSFRFAKKFFTSIERGKDGLNYQLADGTKVWQVGIRSTNAYSINVLFSDFRIPEGGKLFIYNSSHSQVIGSFTSENNSDDGLLPTRPVQGDEIIVEYSEPANVAFEGTLKITEVNHDYINLLAYEPKNDPSSATCMPDLVCQNPSDPNNRSTVLLVVNGDTGCSGTLLNNTSKDGVPYILTASHCLSMNFAVRTMDQYAKAAGSSVIFFNYNRPVCDANFKLMRGTEEMSLAGSKAVCVIDTCDITLLKFNERVPEYYMPYFAGWNIEYNESTQSQNLVPYVNIHHPQGAVGKYGMTNQPLTLYSLTVDEFNFLPSSHWKVNGWNIGSTAPGSSGSPLFNSQKQVVGGLTGGRSLCSGSNPNGGSDYFFALFKGWKYGADSISQLKVHLDPTNTGSTSIGGIDIAVDSSIVILSNADYSGVDRLVNTKLDPSLGGGPLFGNDSLKIKECAEEFVTNKTVQLIGFYIMAPSANLTASAAKPVKINIYKGDLLSTPLDTMRFYPKYTTYQTNGFIDNTKTMGPNPTQTFVKLSSPITVNGKFFISYAIDYPSSPTFSAYNTTFGSETSKSTAWIKDSNGNWYKSENFTSQPMKTSLAIQAIVKVPTNTGIEPVVKQKSDKIRYIRSDHQLYIDADPGESGIVEVYSVTGQLIRRFHYSGQSVFTLQSSTGSTIGIVRMISGKSLAATKIVF